MKNDPIPIQLGPRNHFRVPDAFPSEGEHSEWPADLERPVRNSGRSPGCWQQSRQ